MEKHIDRQATGFAACAPLVKVEGFWKIPKNTGYVIGNLVLGKTSKFNKRLKLGTFDKHKY